jgi:hypothetical protein
VPSLSEVTDEYNKKGQVVENSTQQSVPNVNVQTPQENTGVNPALEQNAVLQPVNSQPNTVSEPVAQPNVNNVAPVENQIPVQNNNELNNVNMVNQPQMAVNTASNDGAVTQAIPVDNNNTIPGSNI